MDIAILFDAARWRGDCALAGGDLVAEYGLRTALLISLFTRRQALADDVLPNDDPSGRIASAGDRGGWWGDFYQSLPGAAAGTYTGAQNAGTPRDRYGSRLWLLSREKATAEVLARAQLYLVECTAWLTDQGIANQVDCTVEAQGMGVNGALDGSSGRRLAYRIDVIRGGQSETHRFDDLWATMAANGQASGRLAA